MHLNAWAVLLQCKLVGKAQKACNTLSIEDSLVYEKLKSAVLQTYELVPEAYRQRFRDLKKTRIMQTLPGRKHFSLIGGVQLARLRISPH